MVSLLRRYDFIRAATFHNGAFRNEQGPCVRLYRCPVVSLRMASTFFLSAAIAMALQCIKFELLLASGYWNLKAKNIVDLLQNRFLSSLM